VSESSTVEHDRLARNCPRHPGLYVALENFGASEQSWDSQSLRLRASGSGRIHGDRARVLRALGRERGGRELDVREEGSLRELCDKALVCHDLLAHLQDVHGCRSLVFFFAARRKPHANALRRERGPRRKRSGELQRREALARRLGAAWTWVRNGHRMSKACGYRLEGTGGGA